MNRRDLKQKPHLRLETPQERVQEMHRPERPFGPSQGPLESKNKRHLADSDTGEKYQYWVQGKQLEWLQPR